MSPSALPPPVRLGLSLAVLLSLAACGEDAAPPPGAPAAPAQAGVGAAALLESLHREVVGGTAMADRSWSDGAAQLQSLLWPPPLTDETRRSAKVHQLASLTAGTTSRDLRQEEGGREGWTKRDPISLDILDAWTAAAAAGPEAYRAWCSNAGAALLQRFEDDRARLFERPR